MLVQGIMRQCSAMSRVAPCRCRLLPSLSQPLQRRGCGAASSRPQQQQQQQAHASSLQSQQPPHRQHVRADATTASAAAEAAAPSAPAAAAAKQPVASLVKVLRSRGLIQDVTSEELEQVCCVVCLCVACVGRGPCSSCGAQHACCDRLKCQHPGMHSALGPCWFVLTTLSLTTAGIAGRCQHIPACVLWLRPNSRQPAPRCV
jgi:hypothetical protein